MKYVIAVLIALVSEVFCAGKYNLSVCAIFNNESKYLREWIEYHRLIGVDHFYLYNNNSTDRPNRMLNSYIKQNIVTLVHWPDILGPLPEEKTYLWSLSTQLSAYQHAIEVKKNETKWLVLLDVDEFLIPTNGNLLLILEKYKNSPGILLQKEHFDASEFPALPKRRLVIESKEMIKGPKENIQKSVEKMIFQPKLCDWFTWPPFKCVFKENLKAVLASRSELKINHYVNRKEKYSIGNSRKKANVDVQKLSEGEIQELLDGGYEIEEPTMDRYVGEVIKKMGLP